ncbi:ATPase [Plasmodium brasilianum]|uniref:DNA helicase, putative n=2 Tax=Plasmodium (Plasmodium) TaxID=418103 RepID=A0A1A8VXF4_PLAMA|nr:ATPase [Plasmodium brasilianum]SBS85263.1 DNA helicase, putative [Plasmodium malariae]
MKRKSVFIKKNVIKSQNTLDKFGIFKKVNAVKNENDESVGKVKKKNVEEAKMNNIATVRIKKEISEEDDNENINNNVIKNENNDIESQSIRVKVKYEDKVTKEKVDDRDIIVNENKDTKREKGKVDDWDVNKDKEKNTVKKNENHINENIMPLHKIYEPIYKEDYINEIRSKRNPLLTKVLEEDLNFNLILCGPAGSGKSSLVNVIKNKTSNLFISLFHLNNLNNELRKIYDQSIINYKLSKRKTILCIKDINRLNKNQQENVLLILKKGYFYLLATCLFNPMNILNASISSRCLYLYLNPYDKIELALIIKRVINKLNVDIENSALNIIINHSCGDARVAINIIDFAIQNMKREELKEKEKEKEMERGKEIEKGKEVEKEVGKDVGKEVGKDVGKEVGKMEKDIGKYMEKILNSQEPEEEIKKNDIIKKQIKLRDYNETLHNSTDSQSSKKVIQLKNIKNFLQNFPSNDNKLDHYNFISGLHKSIRAGNIKAAILYLTKSLKNGEDPLYICRRLIRIASEDIGLANHDVLSICINTHYACKAIGMPECQTALIYAVIVLCKSSKSNYIYVVENNAKQICNEYSFDVPFHLRNTSNKYIYTNQPEILTFEEHLNKYKDVQKYLPDYIENLELLPEL